MMTTARDGRMDQVAGAENRLEGADSDVGDDRVMTDEEFRSELALQKQAWKETERRLVDR
jgi:hypothetical protein